MKLAALHVDLINFDASQANVLKRVLFVMEQHRYLSFFEMLFSFILNTKAYRLLCVISATSKEWTFTFDIFA